MTIHPPGASPVLKDSECGSRFVRLLPFAAVGVLAVALVATSGSWLIARKVVALMILPAGAVWLALFALVWWPGLRRGVRAMVVAAWLVHSLAGSPYLGSVLLRPLEEPYLAHEELAEELDALVLLGGGTTRSPRGRAALGARGDRVVRPVQWYREGKVETLITTGRSVSRKRGGAALSRETSEIWQSLGVPGENIVELSEPRNTAEELAAVAELLAEHPEWERVGLCTSASHLRRAMGEARMQGLELVPVPSDFRAGTLALSPYFVVPQARGFQDVQTALWEYLGGAIQ